MTKVVEYLQQHPEIDEMMNQCIREKPVDPCIFIYNYLEKKMKSPRSPHPPEPVPGCPGSVRARSAMLADEKKSEPKTELPPNGKLPPAAARAVIEDREAVVRKNLIGDESKVRADLQKKAVDAKKDIIKRSPNANMRFDVWIDNCKKLDADGAGQCDPFVKVMVPCDPILEKEIFSTSSIENNGFPKWTKDVGNKDNIQLPPEAKGMVKLELWEKSKKLGTVKFDAEELRKKNKDVIGRRTHKIDGIAGGTMDTVILVHDAPKKDEFALKHARYSIWVDSCKGLGTATSELCVKVTIPLAPVAWREAFRTPTVINNRFPKWTKDVGTAKDLGLPPSNTDTPLRLEVWDNTKIDVEEPVPLGVVDFSSTLLVKGNNREYIGRHTYEIKSAAKQTVGSVDVLIKEL